MGESTSLSKSLYEKMNDKVSIVLPSYNGSDMIENSIESILKQSYSNWELILVDDCSNDSTGIIIDRYADRDERIIAIHNEVNRKLPQSLNIGFSRSTGVFRTWTSDDNAYHRDALEKMVDYLAANNDLDMVYADMNIVDSEGHFLSRSEREEPEMLRFINIVGACFLYKTSIATQVGDYDPGVFLAEDYEYWLRIFLHGEIGHLHEVLYDYGKTSKSLTATKAQEIQKQTFRVKNMYKNELLSKCHTQKEKNRFYTEMINLLPQKQEKRKMRMKYYKENGLFLWGDLSRRLNHYLKKSWGN